MHRQSVAFKKPLAGIAHGPHKIAALSVATPKAAQPAAVQEIPALRNMLADWQRLILEIQARQAPPHAEVAQMSVELGVAIAERLLGTEIAANRQRLQRIVQSTLERMPAARFVVVRGHPDDLSLLQKQVREHAELQGHDDVLTFRPEESLKRGQFKLEADEWFTEWDTTRSLADLRAALLEETFTDE